MSCTPQLFPRNADTKNADTKDRTSPQIVRGSLLALATCLSLACGGGTDSASADGPLTADGATAGEAIADETAPVAAQASEAGQGSAAASSEAGRTETVAGLRFVVPPEWESEAPQSSMRIAQFRVPGDSGDASLVLFRFPGGGGSAEANVNRWMQQFTQPDGTPTQDRAVVQAAEAGPLKLTRLDVSGTYGGQQMPGAPAQASLENARLLALVVEGSGDPYFFKLQGPGETVGKWASAWEAMVQSLTLE